MTIAPYYPFASSNGQIVKSGDSAVSQTGVGIFTTIKIRHSVPLFWERHLLRLTEGAKRLHLDGHDLSRIAQQIKAVIKKNKVTEAAIRVTLIKDKVMIHERPLPPGIPVTVITLPDTREKHKDIKIVDRTELNRASEKAHQAGANDALLTDGNWFTESTLCNIFSVMRGEIITPLIKGRALPGVARKLFMENLQVQEEEIPIDTNGPLVLVNSLRMSKVTAVNGKVLVDGENLLQTLYNTQEKIEQEYLKSLM